MKKFGEYVKENKIWKNPDFIKDFDGSKVVDSNGKPMLMYHGGSYTRFSGNEFKGIGWFTCSKPDARYYAKQSGNNVTSAYLVIKNPLYTGEISHLNIKVTKEILDSFKKRHMYSGGLKVENGIIQFIEANNGTLIARDCGYDGVIDIDDGEILDSVIFDSKQLLFPEDYK